MLVGGKVDEHQCSLERSIGYYLQVLFCLAPFSKQPMDITLKGVTNDPDDVSVCSLDHNFFIKEIYISRLKFYV